MKAAVLLAGCGRYDGSEVHESVLALLALEEAGATWHCYAPDAEAPVHEHATGRATKMTRNMLAEGARIARGRISALSSLRPDDYEVLVVPGGAGVARNFSDWASHGAKATVRPEVAAALHAAHDAGRPIALICVAPHLAALLWPGVMVTLGDDPDEGARLREAGAKSFAAAATEAVVDEAHKVVSTPAYMNAPSMLEARAGIQACILATLDLAGHATSDAPAS